MVYFGSREYHNSRNWAYNRARVASVYERSNDPLLSDDVAFKKQSLINSLTPDFEVDTAISRGYSITLPLNKVE